MDTFRHDEIGSAVIDALLANGFRPNETYDQHLSGESIGQLRYKSNQQNMLMSHVSQNGKYSYREPAVRTGAIGDKEAFYSLRTAKMWSANYIRYCAETFSHSLPQGAKLSPEELEMPGGVPSALMVKKNGIYARVVSIYDIQIDEIVTRVDVLWTMGTMAA